MLRVLRHRDFGLLWLGQAVSLVGDGIYLVAIAWLVLDISNEPTALGLVGLAWTLPMVVSLLIAGVLSDRFERRRLMITADLLRCAAIAAIAALALAETAIGLTPVSFALTGPIADALGVRKTLAGAGVLGLFTFAFLFIPGVRDPERIPLPDGNARLGSVS